MSKGKRRLKDRGRERGHVIRTHDAPPISTDKDKPLFSLYNIVSGYSVENCQKDDKCYFAEALRKASQKNWLELNNTPCDKGGIEKLKYGLGITAPRHAPKGIGWISLHMSKDGRVVGYREGAIFHIYYIDPRHKTYKG